MDPIGKLIDRIFAQKAAKREATSRAHRALALAACRSLLRNGHPKCFDPVVTAPYAPDDIVVTAVNLEASSKCVPRLVELVRGGECCLDDPIWTSGFLEGLRLSGALVRGQGSTGWELRRVDDRPGLDEAFRGCPWHRIEVRRRGCLELRHFVAGEAPAEDPYGADVLAGLLAGSRKRRSWDGTWLAVRQSEGVDRLLCSWGIGSTRRRGLTLISPFWGAVMARRMPGSLMAWLRTIRRPACCPLLPMAVWRMAGLGGLGLPFPGALPWGRTRREFSTSKVLAREVRSVALERWGLSRIEAKLRLELVACRDLAVANPSTRVILGHIWS